MRRIKKLERKIRKRAIKKAMQSLCRYKISALGFNAKGELVHIAMNGFHQSKYGGGLHAEEKVFRVAAKKNIVKIIIARVGNNGDVLPIEPCPKCKKIADKLNIQIESVK
jgi:hypothetical protein